MKRDLELIRSILLRIEDSENPWHDAEIEIDGHDQNTINFHLSLLIEAGFIQGMQKSDPNSPFGYYVHYPQLCWDGYEFLETIRDKEIWAKAKNGAGQVGSSALKLVGELAVGFAKQKAIGMGLPIA
ncbi:DUF2513 domain-containing protein [Qipengyuania sp. ASV99]|uniref:DUF2513 domain-containing protein n=1 Tax=Qipengyuania sp. ASV99 TaxID=3399681 RepID=UPI003A4C7604